MEEQGGGAQIVKVEHMTQPTASENALFVKALVIKHLNVGTRIWQDPLMWEEERKLELTLELLELGLVLIL